VQTEDPTPVPSMKQPLSFTAVRTSSSLVHPVSVVNHDDREFDIYPENYHEISSFATPAQCLTAYHSRQSSIKNNSSRQQSFRRSSTSQALLPVHETHQPATSSTAVAALEQNLELQGLTSALNELMDLKQTSSVRSMENSPVKKSQHDHETHDQQLFRAIKMISRENSIRYYPSTSLGHNNTFRRQSTNPLSSSSVPMDIQALALASSNCTSHQESFHEDYCCEPAESQPMTQQLQQQPCFDCNYCQVSYDNEDEFIEHVQFSKAHHIAIMNLNAMR
jgi:hypothetical protein